MEAVTKLLEGGHPVDPQEEHGFTPLHNACALDKPAQRASLVTLLIAHAADPCRADNEGYSCLHWAAACGAANVIQPLLDAGARPSQRSIAGETALHRAARLSRTDCVKALASAGGIELLTWPNNAFHSPLDVAGKVGVRVNRVGRTATRRAMLDAHPAARTLVLHHEDCQLHLTGEHHQEHPLRLDAILALIQASRSLAGGAQPQPSGSAGSAGRRHSPLPGNGGGANGGGGGGRSSRGNGGDSPASNGSPSTEVARPVGRHQVTSSYELPAWEVRESSDFEAATTEQLVRVHDPSYVAMVRAAASRMAANPPASPVPLTPMVQQARGASAGSLKDPTTSDTKLSPGSYAAARRAAGAVIRAIDEVCAGRARHALCVVRPPGHHAGVRGLIPGSVSCGFCVFNSVMVGVAHALHGGGRRVAVVDFDVHHGDGSEEIVRRLAGSHSPNELFFASIHLYDPGDATFGAFYPASGSVDAMAQNIINVPLSPMWRGKTPLPNVKANRAGGAAGPAASPRMCGCGRAEWRTAFAQRIIPSLRAFSPDLILLSAGFDGGCNDIGNSKLDVREKYHQGLDLTPSDFEWATLQCLSVAAVCCPGKVVSVLEGGYGAYQPDNSKESATGWTVSRSQLAENVSAHLSALAGIGCHAE